jgi:hypothetical protein
MRLSQVTWKSAFGVLVGVVLSPVLVMVLVLVAGPLLPLMLFIAPVAWWGGGRSHGEQRVVFQVDHSPCPE